VDVRPLFESGSTEVASAAQLAETGRQECNAQGGHHPAAFQFRWAVVGEEVWLESTRFSDQVCGGCLAELGYQFGLLIRWVA